MKVELIACSRPLPGQCGTVTNLIGVTPNPISEDWEDEL